jgi:membrane protease YdiL (CAAX protease family)
MSRPTNWLESHLIHLPVKVIPGHDAARRTAFQPHAGGEPFFYRIARRRHVECRGLEQDKKAMEKPPRTDAKISEAILISLICAGISVFLSVMSAFSGGHVGGEFSDPALLSLICEELACAALSLAFLRGFGYSLSSLKPVPTYRDAGIGIGLYILIALAIWLCLAPLQATMKGQEIDKMLERATVTLPVIFIVSLVNGTFEEVFFLGFLAQGLRRFGFSVCVGIPLAIRLLCHVYQGPVGALAVTLYGLAVGIYFYRTGRLFPVVVCHFLSDFVPFFSNWANHLSG